MEKNKKDAVVDPYLDREAAKYERPIVSRESILGFLESAGQPVGQRQIAEAFDITEEDTLEALRRRLRAMERDGQLVCNRRGSYGVAKKMDLVSGRVTGHPDGFGFLIPDDGGDDLFLTAKQMRAVFHGDRAMAQVIGVDRRGRREGNIVEVLERNTRQLVGRFHREGSVGFVVADNKRVSQDVVIPPEGQMGVSNGQVVVIEITEQPTQRTQALGRVIEVLGDHLAPGMEIEVAIRSHQLPHAWSPEVQAEIAGLTPEIPSSAHAGRQDVRALPLVTIDGEDSRDFDDAVFCERQGAGWRLIVAIADVSSYVKPGTALDREAYERGNSVYFPQNVIPMLPEILSNELCSLNPAVDRLCLCCEMTIDEAGQIGDYRFFEGVMRSHARLTYTKVAKILIDGDQALRTEYQHLLPALQALHDLYQALRGSREQRGAIDFDRTETKIVFGEGRKISSIVPLVRNDAHRMIEEFMISANIAAAEYLLKHEIPAVYRIHQEPSADKLDDVREFLSELGLKLAGGKKPRAVDYARLIGSVAQRPDRHLIETVMLRSLSQAMYSPENIGHFGLALEAYTHFTSPIRRYPDLVVHRAIRHLLSGGKVKAFYAGGAVMKSLGDHTSMTERRADEATREAVLSLKCEYMQDKVGVEYPGFISSVTSFGLFVELEEVFVEGLVHITELDNDYYHFDPVRHRMTGDRLGKVYRLGDRIRVKVSRVDLDERKIDFVLARETIEDKKPKRRPRRKKKA